MIGRLEILVLAAALALAPAAAGAATFVIVNNDSAGEGFNDPAPRAPVGGNPGTTLGQQRLNVFQHAANIWGAILPSTVTIQVRAQFNPQTCSPTGAVLGSAGPTTAHRDFANAEYAGTWYHQALANKLSGSDLNTTQPDINATFNKALDAGCFPGGVWYYGLDGNEGNDIELLPVVLHEIGHGLGFSTLVNASTGALFSGLPDLYARHIYDNTTGQHWHQMTNAQRQASALNSGNLAWDGPAVTAGAPFVLDAAPRLTVTAPAGISGEYAGGSASFGAPLTGGGLAGELVLADDGIATTTDGCEPIVNAVAGKIAVIDRGSCNFSVKALNAQNAGALGVVIANNVPGPPPPLGGTDPLITIPVVSVSQADGLTLKTSLETQTVIANVGLSATRLAGSDAAGRVLLFAPNPLQSGSSISHFDVSVTPNALMEPFINDDLSSGVDLTHQHFEDLGWLERTTGVPAPATPVTVQLRAAAPNPFSATTAIRYEIQQAGMMDLAIYDLRGSLVKRIRNAWQTPGAYTEVWNGTDAHGHRVPSGVYLYRLRSAEGSASKRMVLLP